MPSRLARRTLFLAALSLVLSLALSDSSAEVSVFLEELSSAASDPFSVSVSLSCDCGQTKCNCLKVCECKLPAEVSGAQVRAGGSGPPLAAARPRRHKGNAAARGAGAAGGGAWQGSWQHEAGAGWQPASARELEASDAEGGAAAPAAAASFLQAEMHPGLNQPMECDCEKCKCTCLRHCACDSGTVTQAGEAFVFIVGHLISYEHMGIAKVECLDECECGPQPPRRPGLCLQRLWALWSLPASGCTAQLAGQ